MEWISVNKELPDLDTRVLVFMSYGSLGNIIKTANYNVIGFDTESDEKISHWMYLPEPPELFNESKYVKPTK